MDKPADTKLFRCAIYTRKSTEHNLDLEFNSLHAQREACEAYIKSQAHEGWRLVHHRLDCRRPPHEPKHFAFRKLHRKMRGTARSGKWALGPRCTTSAYQIFKSFGGRFMTALPPGLIFECADQANRIQAAPGNTVTWLRVDRREFLNVKRTSAGRYAMSAFEPTRTSAAEIWCDARCCLRFCLPGTAFRVTSCTEKSAGRLRQLRKRGGCRCPWVLPQSEYAGLTLSSWIAAHLQRASPCLLRSHELVSHQFDR
jgi:hypothetical protein